MMDTRDVPDAPRQNGAARFIEPLRPFLLADQLENVVTAYVFSKYGHRGQQRESGGRYFDHPKSVGTIIIEELRLRTDWEIICAALLHDIPEDSFILTEHRIVLNFGTTVAYWLKLLTKELGVDYFGRLLDVAPLQVLIIKLCDRLHNVRTLGACKPEKQRRYVVETREQVLPLVARLDKLLPSADRWRADYLRDQLERLCAVYEAQFGVISAPHHTESSEEGGA